MHSENEIRLEIVKIEENEKKNIDGIAFSNICYIDIIILGPCCFLAVDDGGFFLFCGCSLLAKNVTAGRVDGWTDRQT